MARQPPPRQGEPPATRYPQYDPDAVIAVDRAQWQVYLYSFTIEPVLLGTVRAHTPGEAVQQAIRQFGFNEDGARMLYVAPAT